MIKTQFFANVSHELRTPLTLIMAPVHQLLGTPDLPAAHRRQLEVVERQARLLLRQVNTLLEASKLEAGRVELAYEEVDLAELVRLVAEQYSSVASEKEIALAIQAPRRLQAEVDPERLQRALSNLVTNAFKFTPRPGRVRVELRSRGAEAVIEVADNGSGIAAEYRDLVFERFRQVEGGSDRRFGGTGLGLAITRDIALLHRGTVTVDDAPEGGALPGWAATSSWSSAVTCPTRTPRSCWESAWRRH